MQTVREIPGFGAIKITTARYFTPSGNSIQAKGIVPDVEIPRAELKVLPKITGWGEGDLDGALSAEEGKKAKETEVLKEDEKKDMNSDEKKDYQLDRALDIVRAMAVFSEQKEGVDGK